MQTRTDETGRTLFSICIGDLLVVRDEPNADAAVESARRWLMQTDEGHCSAKEELWQQKQ